MTWGRVTPGCMREWSINFATSVQSERLIFSGTVAIRVLDIEEIVAPPREKFLTHFRRKDADIGQITVAFGAIHAIADDEKIFDGESHVVSMHRLHAVRRLVEQGGYTQRARLVG